MYKWLFNEKGQKIVEWLVSEIFSFVLDISKDAFVGWRGKLKLKRLKCRLRKDIFERILKKYGDEVYYNDLDSFLSQNNILRKVIDNCADASVSQYRSNRDIVAFYIKQFEEEHPEYIRYHCEIISILQQCLDIIFINLNQIEDEKLRIVCNVVKEVSGELSFQIREMDLEMKEIHRKINWMISNNQPEKKEFSYQSYFEYVMRSYPQYSVSDYISRNIYLTKQGDEETNVISTLMQEKKVLLLGEAGYGKTYEAISLVKNICMDEKMEGIIPFYLPLSEYGMLFTDIKDGIKNKMKPFVNGSPEEVIEEWLRGGQTALILDGIDDIVKEENRTKFVLDVKNVAQQYDNCYYFITSRINRYHRELDEFNPYYLAGLDRNTIQSKLLEDGITVHIPDNYYQLFANPLFFEAGRIVLKKNADSNIFNRSILFEELIRLLYSEWNQRKGIVVSQPLSCVEVVTILGKIAFDAFDQPSYGCGEFEKKIMMSLMECDSTGVIGSVISSGIIKISDTVGFTHKLFKEYCVAYYLFSKYPYKENKPLYLSLIDKEEWKEVFIFIVGMYDRIQDQDVFMDFLMEHNLQLYVECINARNDLYAFFKNAEHDILANRYLEQIYKTYNYIVSNYFLVIAHNFAPSMGCGLDLKLIIVGSLSLDNKHLTYWFDYADQRENDVVVISEDELAIYQTKRKQNVLKNRGRSFGTCSINLELAGLEGDGGRKIAIDVIKCQLETVLRKQLLIESDYLLCERINCDKKKIKELKQKNDLVEMKKWVDEQIELSRRRHPNTEINSCSYSGVELFELQARMEELLGRGIRYDECILPEQDVNPDSVSVCYTWELYSKKQLVNRISDFFCFHQLSYAYMVEKNFPTLKNLFSRYLDVPYRSVIIFDSNDEIPKNGFRNVPGFTYYYVAAPNGVSGQTEIRQVNSRIQEDDIFQQMRLSYQMVGKQIHRCVIGTTTIMTYLDEDSLRKHVYESIKESLEEIFGHIT